MNLIANEADMAEGARQAFSASEASRMQAAARLAGYESGYAAGRRDGVLAERKRCVFLLCEAGYQEAAYELGML